jgi:tRNA 2-thiouridine synthesizing protein C
MSKSIGIINHKAPFDNFQGKEAQDLALIFGSYEQDITLYFIGDGVYHFTGNQNPSLIGAKDYLKTYEAFGFYDIEKLFVCHESLEQRGISDLPDFVTIISRDKMKEALNQHKTIFNF